MLLLHPIDYETSIPKIHILIIVFNLILETTGEKKFYKVTDVLN